MGYRIQYDSMHEYQDRKRHRGGLSILTGVSFFVFLLLVALLWPEGAEQIQSVIPVSLLDQFSTEILHTKSLKSAIVEWISIVFP